MPSNDERWLDAEAGPVVRPYALTRGRTRHSGEAFDLVATVTATHGQDRGPGRARPGALLGAAARAGADDGGGHRFRRRSAARRGPHPPRGPA